MYILYTYLRIILSVHTVYIYIYIYIYRYIHTHNYKEIVEAFYCQQRKCRRLLHSQNNTTIRDRSNITLTMKAVPS